MVLPESSAAALFLLVVAILCFAGWPHIFKRTEAKWQFELFSMDFGLGAVLLALLAAYTLGSRGSDLGFADSMLVAGQRAEAVAFLSGLAFALGVMCYLGASALIGMANASLLTFSVFGCVAACFYLEKNFYITSIVAFAIWILAATLAVMSALSQKASKAVKPQLPKTPGLRRAEVRRQIPVGAKGGIVGSLGGLSFAGVFPLMAMAQPEQLGVGAYGGVLLASAGVLLSTICLNFFFFNISLEGKKAGYSTFLGAGWKLHLPGILAGAVCAVGTLCLFTSYTGAAGVTRLQAWLTPLLGGLLAASSGVVFLPKAKGLTVSGLAAFAVAAAVFLFGFRS